MSLIRHINKRIHFWPPFMHSVNIRENVYRSTHAYTFRTRMRSSLIFELNCRRSHELCISEILKESRLKHLDGLTIVPKLKFNEEKTPHFSNTHEVVLDSQTRLPQGP